MNAPSRSLTGGQFEQGRIIPVDIVENVSTALGIAAQGMAATLGPAYVGLLARLLGLTMRPIVQPEVTRQVCIYHSSTRAMSPAAQGFCEFFWRSSSKATTSWGVGGVWRLR
ncbi:LysR substrate-binding domain-containing protein [Pseudomonas lini]